MSETVLDYARFGRQLALREVGPGGQRALAENPARFTGENGSLAAHLHARAGGSVGDTGVARDAGPAAQPALALGCAAYAALEHARAVLSLGPALDSLPDAMRARLTLDPEDNAPTEPR